MYFRNMKTYTTHEVAKITGKTLQAISRYAQAHPGVGKKYGRDWIFSERDLAQLTAVKRGGSKPRKPQPEATP